MKKIVLLTLIALLVGAGIATAGEQIDLTAPISITSYKVIGLNLDWEGATITIYLRNATTGVQSVFMYQGTVATNLMIGLNKANLSTNSLQKRILERLVTDGKLTGTISGTPD